MENTSVCYMLLGYNLGKSIFLTCLIAIFLMPVSSAGLIEVSVNNSSDLVGNEDEIVIQEGKDMNLYLRVKGQYRESGNNNTVDGMTIKLYFRNNEDPRDSLIGYPDYQPLCDTCEDPGYDEYLARFRTSDAAFAGYNGIIEFDIILKNKSNEIVWSEIIPLTLQAKTSESSDSDGFTMPELPPAIEENLIPIVVGLLVIILLSVGIYTFVLAPEDTTADLYKPIESVDPLKKSLTGVGHKSELPSKSKLKRLENSESEYDDEEDDEEEEKPDYEDDFDNEDEDFDERKILDELTGTHSVGKEINNSENDDETEEKAAPVPVKKKAIKKRISKKKVSTKVKKAPTPKVKKETPEVNMGKGIKSVTCPSCSKIHNIDDNTTKFICSCGRRIRV